MRATCRPRALVLALILSVTAVTIGAACSDEAEPDPKAACQKLAAVFCGKLDSCSPILVSMSYGDAATCITRYEMGCLGALTANGSQLSAAQISDCASATSAQSCTSLQYPPPDACRPQPGTLADGVACAEDHQCVGAYCKKGIGGSCGVCSKRVLAGQPCASGADCDYGLACPLGTCVMPVDAGGVCDKDKPCRDPAVCVNGVCTNPGSAGAACDSVAGNCDAMAGLFCNPLTKVCETMKVANSGESCGLLSTGITVCRASGKCKTAVGVPKGTCMKAAGDGEACDDTQGPSCLPPASCVNKVCKLDDPAACK